MAGVTNVAFRTLCRELEQQKAGTVSGLYVCEMVTARALASLDKLLGWAERHLLPEGHCVFLKGRGVEDELTLAAKEWNISCERFPSLSDPSGTILHLKEVRRG